MPFYDYSCLNCNHSVTVLQKRTDEAPDCNVCDSGAMQKQIALCGFSLSGSGWYKDGYKVGDKAAKETV